VQLSVLPSLAQSAARPQITSVPETEKKATTPASVSLRNNEQILSEKEQRIVAQLKQTDREVRAHEAAHLAAAGGLARGGASLGYTQGPDGQRYAVSGEVSIDTSPANTPETTLMKAQRIQAAALAPAQPSGADQAVAAAASQMAATARAELLAQQSSANGGTSGSANGRQDAKPEMQSELNQPLAAQENEADKSFKDEEKPASQTNVLVDRYRQTTGATSPQGNLLDLAV